MTRGELPEDFVRWYCIKRGYKYNDVFRRHFRIQDDRDEELFARWYVEQMEPVDPEQNARDADQYRLSQARELLAEAGLTPDENDK